MKKRGMTLVELMVSMVVASVLMLAMALLFAADLRIRSIVNNEIAATQEALSIVQQITDVFRFHHSSGALQIQDMSGGLWNRVNFRAYIEGGHLSQFPNEATVRWRLASSNGIYTLTFYDSNTSSGAILGRGVSFFHPQWDAVNKVLTITLTVTRGVGASARAHTVTTHIYPLPDRDD